ncbi:MAG: PAS domain S-box protein [Bacteroidetes bacterium]|nr:PAS domain S-box protein [Bacteroidota bacterium]
MKSSNKKSKAEILRQKAEEALKKYPINLSETDTLKLLHELEVHQIELNLQNEELLLAKKQADTAAEKFIELFDYSPTGYFILSKEGKITDLNLTAAQMICKDRSRLKNKSFCDFVTHDTKPVFNLFLRKVFTGKVKESCDVKLSDNKNSPIFVHIVGVVRGNWEQCFVTIVDITERLRNEEKIRYQSGLLENVSDAVIATDIKYNIQFWNKTAEKQYGWKASEVIGKPFGMFIKNIYHGDSLEAILQKISQDGYWKGEVTQNHRDGSLIPIISTVSRITDEANQITDFISVNRDITEYKQAVEGLQKSEDSLRKVNAEKDKFFSIIAHDLHSPFQTFFSYSPKMAEELPTFTLEKSRKIIVYMRNAANKLFNFVDNLLEWALMQRGLMGFKPETFIISDNIGNNLELIFEAADNKKITISYDIPENLKVIADLHMFEGLMRNLIFNAVKFTPKNGKIKVAAKPQPNNAVEISISDTGIGMNKKITDNLFQLSEQINRKGTEGEPSTGLGLIICKDFIEKHGGKIWVESEEGKGSTFSFMLPGSKELGERKL